MPTKRDLTKSTWALRAKKAIRVASDVAQDVIKLRNNPKISDYVALGMRGAQIIISNLEDEIYNYYEDWYCIDDIAFKDELIEAIQSFPTEKLGGSDVHGIMLTTVHGEEVGWIRKSPADGRDGGRRSSAPSVYEGPWINFDRYDETFAALGRALWEHVGHSNVVLTASTVTRYDRRSTNTRLKPDLDIKKDVFSSKKGQELFERIKKFYDAGENRSLILLGPPGTGKTTIMKYIAAQFNKFTMRVNVSELSDMRSETVLAAVQLMKPEILLIDDFDRFGASSSSMLTQIEQVNKAVKLFMVSVNDITRLDPAVIRPGRFDEIIEICDIDEAAIDAMVADLPDDVKTLMRTWPVAYISEFAKRYKVLGVTAALNEVAELRYRIEKINNHRYSGFNLGNEGMAEAVAAMLSGTASRPRPTVTDDDDDEYS